MAGLSSSTDADACRLTRGRGFSVLEHRREREELIGEIGTESMDTRELTGNTRCSEGESERFDGIWAVLAVEISREGVNYAKRVPVVACKILGACEKEQEGIAGEILERVNMALCLQYKPLEKAASRIRLPVSTM